MRRCLEMSAWCSFAPEPDKFLECCSFSLRFNVFVGFVLNNERLHFSSIKMNRKAVSMGISLYTNKIVWPGVLGEGGVSSRVAGGPGPLQLPLGQTIVKHSHTHTGVSSSMLRPRNPTGFSNLPGAKPVKTCLGEGRFPPGRTENSAGGLGSGTWSAVHLSCTCIFGPRENPRSLGGKLHTENPLYLQTDAILNLSFLIGMRKYNMIR